MEHGSTSTSDRTGILSGPMSWQASLIAGLITVVLGIIVAALPAQSVTVIAVLLGILMIVSGIYHLLAVFGSGDQERLWHGIAGLLFVLVGVVLIRHLNVSVAIIGLVIGFSWIAQGVSLLIVSSSGRPRGGAAWTAFFGILSLIAGIVVVAAPVSSTTVLAALTGILFIVMGLLEMLGALALRRLMRKEEAKAKVPGQRGAARGGSRDSSRQDAGR